MKRKLFEKLEIYNFSGCREITGDELFNINGGGRRESANNNNKSDSSSSSSPDSYTVQSGDTLSQIVHDYNQANGTNLTVNEVAQLSGIENPGLIHPGQSIVFGTPSESNNSESIPTQSSTTTTENYTNVGYAGNIPESNTENSFNKKEPTAILYAQFNNLNENKSNKFIGNILLDKIAGAISKFLSPDTISIDMNPNNSTPKNLRVITPKVLVENQSQNLLSGDNKFMQNQVYIKQGALGVGELALGVGIWVGTTFYVIGAETASLQKGQLVDPAVGEIALSGYAGGSLFVANGINLITSSCCKKSADPILLPLFKEVYLSSPYQDMGEAIQLYKDR